MRVILLLFLAFCALFSTEFDCKNIKEAFKKEPLNIDENLSNCAGSMLNLAPIKELLSVSKAIRSESPSCVGESVARANLSKFRWQILKASFAPEIYAKTLLSPERAESKKDAQMRYLRYWAHQSLYNFLKFNEFIKAYNKAQTPIVEFYEKNGVDSASAAYYATNVINEFLSFGVGEIDFKRANLALSDDEKLLSDKNISSEQILQMLYSKSFSPSDLTKLLNIALLYQQNEQILAEILKRGADINFGDETPLFFALKNLENVKFLLKNGADINHKNSFGKSALFYAVGFSDILLVKELLNGGANVNEAYIDEYTKTALLSLGSQESLCALEHTARSVFMHAAMHANVEILEILKDAGADINAVDEVGFNAFDYAQIGQNKDALNYLKNLGLNSNINKER